jgi:hypothetical protein
MRWECVCLCRARVCGCVVHVTSPLQSMCVRVPYVEEQNLAT